jgi:pumilio RNA-binding family
VIQKFLENSKGEKLKLILKKLLAMVVPLCKCQFGNYIMQYVVEHGPLEEKNTVLATVKNNFIALSLDKFASNVVEKAIRNSNDFYRK